MLVFEERGKAEFPEKNLSEQSREPATNSTHIMTPGPGIKPGTHLVEGSVEGERSHHGANPVPQVLHVYDV